MFALVSIQSIDKTQVPNITFCFVELGLCESSGLVHILAYVPQIRSGFSANKSLDVDVTQTVRGIMSRFRFVKLVSK